MDGKTFHRRGRRERRGNLNRVFGSSGLRVFRSSGRRVVGSSVVGSSEFLRSVRYSYSTTRMVVVVPVRERTFKYVVAGMEEPPVFWAGKPWSGPRPCP